MSESSTNTDNGNVLLMPVIAALETGLNQLFAMDPEVKSRLIRFRGKIIAFHITDLNQTLYLFPDQQGIQILSHYEGEADTCISGSLIAFARMGMADDKIKTKTVFKGDITISGNISLGQHFQSLFQRLNIDWEEHLSQFTGDIVAHSIGNLTRDLLSWGKQASRTIGLNISEYLQYETRDLASGPEINHFINAVDKLRNDVDRAAARLARITQTLEQKQDQ